MIPKDKHDIAAVEKLGTMEVESVIPLLPQLLEWVQDMNWPIAEPMVELLLHYPNELTPLVEEVLLGDDDMWIYWCLVEIVPKLPFYSKLVLANAVEQIATMEKTPFTEDNIEAAKEALLSFQP
ncbi:DUF5071 domain-containing protein [Solibacillus sp. FSL K6-1781]|uniref:DUF5071 domain-containing protein n=1 Tax=Solibacillus sp. FSL K6-1781 TaxID=2921474 RepID=UPI00315A98D5